MANGFVIQGSKGISKNTLLISKRDFEALGRLAHRVAESGWSAERLQISDAYQYEIKVNATVDDGHRTVSWQSSTRDELRESAVEVLHKQLTFTGWWSIQ